ncbi:MAG: transglutaminase domain-containing protein [Lachnospiraceae bacterium]|nr:transglutaminase domain-containing protein [Lachnospiraceae bacterium]
MSEDSFSREDGRVTLRGNFLKAKRMRLLFILILIIIAGIIIFFLMDRVKRSYEIEAGKNFSVSMVMKRNYKGRLTDQGEKVKTDTPGTYRIIVRSGISNYPCEVTVKDTVKPQGQPVQISTTPGKAVKADKFVTDIKDATKVKVSFKTKPDFKTIQTSKVTVVLTDLGNNKTEVTSSLNVVGVKDSITVEAGSSLPEASSFALENMDPSSVSYASNDEITTYINDNQIKDAYQDPDLGHVGKYRVYLKVGDLICPSQIDVTDTTAPVITAKDFTVEPGSTISYKDKVSITDNAGNDNIKLEVDHSKVDANTEGTYPIVYTATDASGNSASKTINVQVKKNVPVTTASSSGTSSSASTVTSDGGATEATVSQMASTVIAQITTPGMSQRDKLTAIYNWVRGHVTYIGHSDKSSDVQGAYEGLKNRKGDCFVYAKTAKALLNAAGIQNRDIEKIPSKTRHYWNLVNIGEGWYHFDTTPRKGSGDNFNYVNDATLMAYSKAHNNSHNYDRSVYTDIQ